MRFAQPWWLLLLVALPILAWLRGRQGGRPAFIYSSVSLVKGIVGVTRSHVGRILWRMRWLALVLLIVGMARPQKGQGEQTIKASGVDIVVVLDLSSSMRSEDFMLEGQRANRLAVAKDVLQKFIKKRSNDRVGLVAFAGRAYIVSPPTLDHDFLLQNLARLEIGIIEDSTAIGSGLTAAINRLRDLNARSKIVILMTDGKNNAGKVPPLTAAEAAQTLGIKVYTLGVGIRGQAPYPETDAFGYKRYRMIDVDIDEETLQQIAQRTGAAYFRADSTSTLADIYDRIDRFEKSEAQVRKFQRYTELFPLVVLPGFVLLMLELILANTVWRRLP